MSYASINDPAGRPLGFNRTILPYTGNNEPNPCITIQNTGGRRIEIMAQSITGSSNICIDSQDGNKVCSASLYKCEQANGDSATYEFYCVGESCEADDVQMFFRFTVSPPSSEIDPELWCSDRDTSQYPLSLSPPLPPDRTIPPIRTTKTSSAETSHGIHLLSMVATFMLAMFMSFRYNK
ncbi:hypothetical protein BSL78_05059 [Apostichopus japonicus]|uniref:Uncharacterized protein n=1 Tax=Stichopus japonicus TaxID=307972 RepID=A0A2G8LCQ2_STIJA|nr:hypothetical protein BSL78_05059 [Apostichopus japonicus]